MSKTKFLFNFVLTVFFVLSPTALLANTENPIKMQACIAAKMDAYKDTNHTLWRISGALFLILGIVTSNIIVPSPPYGRLAGKSPEYVKYYLDCYKEIRSDVQNRDAQTGCVYTFTVFTGILEILLIYYGLLYIIKTGSE